VLEPMKDLVKVLEENTQWTIESEGARAELGLDVGLLAEKALEIIQEPGLTAEEIAELEKRLDVQLPMDYKEFLSTSNGLGMTWSEILMDPPLHAACCAQHPGNGIVLMEALLILLPKKLEGQPHTYLCTESPLGPHFSWTIPAEPYEPANRNRNAAYSQHCGASAMER
jgi:hypothetical protein